MVTIASCVCMLEPSAKMNWIISQHINRSYNTLIPPSQINVTLNFGFGNCSDNQISFALHIWETSTIDLAQARNISNFHKLQMLTSEMGTNLTKTVKIKLGTNETGFYLAFIAHRICIFIKRVVVYYAVCPAIVSDLMIFPDLPVNQNIIAATCVPGASGKGSAIRCIPGSKWIVQQNGTGCRCEPGYINEENKTCRGKHHVHS